jgi:ABC-2 type transport system permease protein
MPAFVLPQVLLCGLFVPREALPGFLEVLSNALPLSYAVDAMEGVSAGTEATSIAGDFGIVALFVVAALGLGAATLRRRTA